MKDANVKLKISGDASGFVQASAQAQAAAENGASAIARAYSSVTVSIKTAADAVKGFRATLGNAHLIITMISAAINIFNKIADAVRNAGKASDELAPH